MTNIKIALAALLFAATSSTAFGQGFYDPNLVRSTSVGALHFAQVHLQKPGKSHRQWHPQRQQRDAALPTAGAEAPQSGPFWYSWSGPTTGGM